MFTHGASEAAVIGFPDTRYLLVRNKEAESQSREGLGIFIEFGRTLFLEKSIYNTLQKIRAYTENQGFTLSHVGTHLISDLQTVSHKGLEINYKNAVSYGMYDQYSVFEVDNNKGEMVGLLIVAHQRESDEQHALLKRKRE